MQAVLVASMHVRLSMDCIGAVVMGLVELRTQERRRGVDRGSRHFPLTHSPPGRFPVDNFPLYMVYNTSPFHRTIR